jgi:hypothetical protein
MANNLESIKLNFMTYKMNQKIDSISSAKRINKGCFSFNVFMENGDVAVWFNNLPQTIFNAGDLITYQLIDKGYFEPTLKLYKPKQTLNK